MSAITCIEQFAGPGGMSEAMKLAGMDPAASVGIEFDKDACDTAEANGHPRVHVDITRLNPDTFVRHFGITRLILLHGSPPCQGFSMAGGGVGRRDTQLILKAIAAMKRGDDPKRVVQRLAELAQDDKSALCLYPLYWAIVLRPENVSMEQVPTVLLLWEAVADCLEHFGYSVWTGNVQAEQYAVPQTRKRAIMLASRVRTVSKPTPTHSRFHNRNPKRLDEGVLPWVSMAEALGWGMTRRPYPTVSAGTAAGGQDPQMIGGSGARATITKEREQGRWIDKPTHMGDVYNSKGCIRAVDQPAPTMTSSMDNGNFRFFKEGLKSESVRVEVEEAATLQSFPKGYEWRGRKTAQYQQVGNAVPPLLGAAMLRHLLADELEQRA